MSTYNSSEKKHVKSYEELEFTDDFLFCKIMENNVDLCKELTELILNRKIGKIIPKGPQKAIEITSDGKGVRFDVYMEDDTSTIYDIEMQQTNADNLPKRMRYYQGMIDLDLMERGAKYAERKKSYIIFICCERPFPKGRRHIYNLRTMCVEEPTFLYSDDACKVVLSAKGEENDVSEEMIQFLLYLTERKTGSEFTRRLQRQVNEARQHKKWRVEYMTLLERDEKMREEGRIEGLKEGAETEALNIIRNIMKVQHKTAEEAMDLLSFTDEKREKLLAKLKL